jgi:hypothetical protein
MLSLFTMYSAANAATIIVTGDYNIATKVDRLTTNQTWTANNEYVLPGLITVGNGATLTIEPGTVIRGQNARTTGSEFRPGALIVEKGGKLIANGTAENPIIFTDEWDDHMPWKTGVPGTIKTRDWNYRNKGTTVVPKINDSYDYGSIGDLHGVWGGIVLCGKAYVNMDSATLGTATILVEGTDTSLTLNGGGSDDNDSSGEISYVQIRYGGSVLKDGGEINGLTMYGVGRGTKIHHVEVYNNQDDMFEFFGGCVNTKYLVSWGAGDDLFDSDNGYRGKNQFLFGVQRDMRGGKIESGASDKGMEMDGGEKSQAAMAQLFSASVWANVTLIGNQFTDPATTADKTRNVAISMRDNASPRIYNSIFMDFSSVATMIENRESQTGYTVSGIVLSPSMRFQTLSTKANLPADTYNGGATTGMTADQSRSYFYGDGVLADEFQACIRGCYFWNFNKNNTASSSSGKWPTVTSSTWAATYPWTGSGVGSGPWVDGAGNTAYQGWDGWFDRNLDFTSYNGYANTLAADGTNLLPIQYRHRVAVTKVATTNSFHLMHIDPRAANDAAVSATAVPDQWLTPVRFQGAFAPDSNWAKGWTAISTLKSTNASSAMIYGVFGAASLANALVVEGDVTTGGSVSTPAAGTTTVITNTVTTVITNGVNGIVYQNASLITDTGLNSVAAAGLQTSPVLTYTIVTAGTYQLQSTPSLSPATWSVEKTFSVGAGDVPVTVNLTDILAEPAASSMFYKLLKQ